MVGEELVAIFLKLLKKDKVETAEGQMQLTTRDPVQARTTTPARVINTIYQNTGRTPILLQLSLAFTCGNPANNCNGILNVDDVTPPVVQYMLAGFIVPPPAGGAYVQQLPLTVIIPVGYYYRLRDVSGVGNSMTWNRWAETFL